MLERIGRGQTAQEIIILVKILGLYCKSNGKPLTCLKQWIDIIWTVFIKKNFSVYVECI